MKRLEELELLEVENGELLSEDFENHPLKSEDDDVSPPPGINKEVGFVVCSQLKHDVFSYYSLKFFQDYQKLLNRLNEQSSDSDEYDSSADDEEHDNNAK